MSNLGIIPKLALSFSCVAPIFTTYAFIAITKKNFILSIILISATIIAAVICQLIFLYLRKHEGQEKITVISFKPADKEVAAYFVSYLIPIMGASESFYNLYYAAFFALMFFIFIFLSKSFYTNPLLSIIGYKFYEVTVSTGGTYLLITKKSITNTQEIRTVSYATRYTLVHTD